VIAPCALVVALAACACNNRDSPMASPNTPIVSAFTAWKDGFSQAIAPGPGPHVVTLLGGGAATWWEHDAPVTAQFPNGVPVDGTRWTADGKLRVGLGTLDLAARAWTKEPALAVWNQPRPDTIAPVTRVAWFAKATHVAMLIETRDRAGTRSAEIVIAAAADGKERGRLKVDTVWSIAAAEDRLFVAATTPVVVDLDAKVVATPQALQQLQPTRVRENGGAFAAVGADGKVALVRASDGAVIATWDVHAQDAVPISHGVVAVDGDGRVHVGCVDGAAIREAAVAPTDTSGGRVVQVVGDRLVVAGGGVDPIRVAKLTSPCR
jgi:hypothetical protein